GGLGGGGGWGGGAVLEQVDPALDRRGVVLGLDRAGIGLVDEGELARLVARPDRGGHGRDQGAHGRGVVDVLLVAAGELGELVFFVPGPPPPPGRRLPA